MMRIEDLPRPWLLAAMTGVSMSVLLEQVERERAEQAEEAWQRLLGEQYRRPGTVGGQAARDLAVRLIGSRRILDS